MNDGGSNDVRSMTVERGVVYNTNRIGPKTDHCGTPQDTDAGTDVGPTRVNRDRLDSTRKI